MIKLSGNHVGWLRCVAREIREAGQPVSLKSLYSIVPSQLMSAVNDGNVTAKENGLEGEWLKVNDSG